MIEKTISGQDALPNISDAERIFAELLTGLAAAQPGFPLAQLKTFVDQGICPNKTCPAWH